MPGTSIYGLALSYQQTADALRARIRELELAAKAEPDPAAQKALLNRARLIRSMHRDVRGVAWYLANYYPRRTK